MKVALPFRSITQIVSSSEQPNPPKYKVKIFFRRLFSSVVLWSVILTAMFSGNKIISNYVFILIMIVLWASQSGHN